MNIDKIMEEVKQTVRIHDSDIGIDFISSDERGIKMKVELYKIDKFIGLSEVAVIVNKVLKRHNTKLTGLSMKHNKEISAQIKKLLK